MNCRQLVSVVLSTDLELRSQFLVNNCLAGRGEEWCKESWYILYNAVNRSRL